MNRATPRLFAPVIANFTMGNIEMKLRITALAGVSLLALASPANAAGDGYYLSLGAGWSEMERLNTRVTFLNGTVGGTGGDVGFDNTARFDIAAGYKLPSGLRLELETGYAQYAVGSAHGVGGSNIPSADGHVSVGTFMGVLAYDFPIAPSWSLTLGGGLGAGRVL